MAHFYGWLRGERVKRITETASETTGLKAVLNGFSFGVRVSLYNDGKEDVAAIYLTGGSNEKVIPAIVGTFTRKSLLETRSPKRRMKKSK